MRAASRLNFLVLTLLGAASVAVARADGASGARPASLSALLAAAPEGGTVTLPAGVFEGGMVVRRNVTIRGAGAARTRIVAPAGDALAFEHAAVVLESVTLEGARTGLVVGAGATATVTAVHARGGVLGVQVERGSLLRADALEITCLGGQEAAIRVRRASLEATRLAASGPCRRGLEISEGVATVVGAELLGAADAGVRVVDGALALSQARVAVADGSTTAASVFAARSVVALADATLRGGEHGVLTRAGRLSAKVLRVTLARGVGVAMNGAIAELAGLDLTGPFAVAAVLASERSEVALSDLAVRTAGSLGLLGVRTRVTVTRASIVGSKTDAGGDFGHGIMLNHAHAKLDGVEVRDLQGAGVYLAESNATLGALRVDSALVGIAAALGSHVSADRVEVGSRSGAGLVAWQRSSIDVREGLVSAQVGSAACAGSDVRLAAGVDLRSAEPVRSCVDGDLAGELRRFVPDRSP